MLQHSVARSQALKAAEALIGRPGAFVAGQWLRNDKTTFPVLDPFEGTVVANVVDCGSEVTQQAISAAHEAQTQWQNTTPHARARLLMEWHRLILQNADILAGVITAENGKTLNEARGEVKYAASFIEVLVDFITGGHLCMDNSGLPKRASDPMVEVSQLLFLITV